MDRIIREHRIRSVLLVLSSIGLVLGGGTL
jgi:hypothetical protein